MKKKFAVILLCVALGASSLNGCGGEKKGTEMGMAQKPEDENAIYGEVSDIEEDAITIKVGTRKEAKQPEGEPPEQPDGEQPEGMPEQSDGGQRVERPAMLDLNGEEEEIAITQETVIKRQGEKISVSDISKGDVVMIIPAEEQGAAEINVMSAMPGGGGETPPADETQDTNGGTV